MVVPEAVVVITTGVVDLVVDPEEVRVVVYLKSAFAQVELCVELTVVPIRVVVVDEVLMLLVVVRAVVVVTTEGPPGKHWL